MFHKRAHTAHDFELNLTPIIDCFVTLICFMLLSTTYVALVGLDAKVPLAVPASAPEAQRKDPTFKLDLVYRKNGIDISAVGAGSLSGKRSVPHIAGKPDLTTLHDTLVKIKKERPKEFTIHFNSDIDMAYADLVFLMDATRNLDPKKDGEIKVTDERNGKVMLMDVLFPDFIIGGLSAAAANPAKGQ
ncbi:MAG TPA: biopolymer transporter ExbD [Oligoflexia bacterium]|nr:biopolymer transporter ExbD [Oligoflexia bacterium]